MKPTTPAKGAPGKGGANKERRRPPQAQAGAPWRSAVGGSARGKARRRGPRTRGPSRRCREAPGPPSERLGSRRRRHQAESAGASRRAVADQNPFGKNLPKTFFDIGVVLKTIQAQRLYEAKRFPSFESFVEREIDLGKTTSMRSSCASRRSSKRKEPSKWAWTALLPRSPPSSPRENRRARGSRARPYPRRPFPFVRRANRAKHRRGGH